jgi:hypothetical protein
MVMRYKERREPHNYFENGGEIFRHLHALSFQWPLEKKEE